MTTAISKVNESYSVTSPSNFNDKSLMQRWLSFVDRPKSAKTYTCAVNRFFRWLSVNQIFNPSRADIIRYRDEMARTLKPASVKLNLNAVKLFISWLSSENLYPNISLNIHTPKNSTMIHSRESLTAADARVVLGSIKTDSEKSLRDKCIIAIMTVCGLRSCEIVRLNIGNVKQRRGVFYLEVLGKGRDSFDVVPLPADLHKMIFSYISLYRSTAAKSAPLFVSTSRRNRYQRLQTQTVSRNAKKYLNGAGFSTEQYTCHSFRHTCANVALDNGVALRDIQKILRHKSLTTTEIYLHDRNFLANPAANVVFNAVFRE